jgi:hypothetical protein
VDSSPLSKGETPPIHAAPLLALLGHDCLGRAQAPNKRWHCRCVETCSYQAGAWPRPGLLGDIFCCMHHKAASSYYCCR